MKIQNNIWSLLEIYTTPLIHASHCGYTEVVKLLLEQKGIDINAKRIYYFDLKFV